ncbi:lysozyme inhibitor LprI family protein [Pandoraea bronchicola]|uniref:Lysozyme inhibitor LprI-like N-terminal domain-containing protein n=1 Tax=Pandoraea bronchicola TaxID=2508287 RepID=A0A5E5BLE1_9BURK|nr:lysozyme inhibitor LprI family protein [Pandoraea bronchicola]VVE87071.1 hypothetical protein PBR20603_00996 [Pandoraea bronchicola]
MMKSLAMLALCLSFAAMAGDGPSSVRAGDIDSRLDRCLDDPGKQSTGDQDECIVNATHAWDARLNASYQALRSDLPEAARAALLEAQRAWLASRDADLKLVGAVYATTRGTMYAPMNANDVMMLTQRRAQALTYYRADLESASAGAFRLEGRLTPATVPEEDGGGAVPQRGLEFERKQCQRLTDAAAIARCASTAAQRYGKDIDDEVKRIERRLPAASRGLMRISADKWRGFVLSEQGLAAAICPPSGTWQGRACVAMQARNEALARLQQLVHLEALIGAD